MSELQKVKIKNLRPNPFRRLDEYPIDREKVNRLKLSIGVAGFWTSIIGRPADDGLVEIAFGHHRHVALTETFGPEDEVEIIVRNLTNEQMLKMMANENAREWGSDGWVTVETIRATLDAYGKGLIELPAVPKDTRKDLIRYVSQNSDSRSYTKGIVAQFLGWTRSQRGETVRPNNDCDVAFAAIDAMDLGLVKPSQIKNVASYQIDEICGGALAVYRAAEKEARRNEEEAKEARKRAQSALTPAKKQEAEKKAKVYEQQAEKAARQKDTAEKNAKEYAATSSQTFQKSQRGQASKDLDDVRNLRKRLDVSTPKAPKEKKVPDLNQLAQELARELEKIASGDDKLSKKFETLKEFKDDPSFDPERIRQLQLSFASFIRRLQKMSDSLTPSHHTNGRSHFDPTSKALCGPD